MDKHSLTQHVTYRPMMLILFILVTYLSPGIVHADSKLTMQNGKLDLTNRPLEEAGPLKLDGEWEFYWEELLEGDEAADAVPKYVTVPDTWHHYVDEHDEPLSKQGVATYRAVIKLNNSDVGDIVSFYVSGIASAYKLWGNGQLIAQSGTVGTSHRQEKPEEKPQIATWKVDSPAIVLLLQVSNFNQRKAGQWESITFGTNNQIMNHYDRRILVNIFVVGSIFIIGAYHLLLFFYRSKDLSPLFLAIVCFSIVVRTVVVKKELITSIFPYLYWELATSLEYITPLVALLFLLFYVQKDAVFRLSRGLIKWLNRFIVLMILFVAIFPARIFTNTFWLFGTIVFVTMSFIVGMSIIGVIRKRSGAILNLVAILILFVAALNDFLYFSSVITTDDIASAGLVFYLFAQSVNLAKKSMYSFERVEQLSVELIDLNKSLEGQVEERTKELSETNQMLQKVEKERRRLMASISHELNTPLTFIQGYIKAMLDGVVAENRSSYLRNVYSDTKIMERLIADLHELSKLRAGQGAFVFKKMDIIAFVSGIYQEQEPTLQGEGYHFSMEKKLADRIKFPIYCLIDPIRMKQAMLNLLVNAKKFTPVGGDIKIVVSHSDKEVGDKVLISIVDTGRGIQEEHLPHLFTHFYKENRKVEQGAGLGLAIFKEIIEQHQGAVGVKSTFGKGSIFFFTLPVVKVNEGNLVK